MLPITVNEENIDRVVFELKKHLTGNFSLWLKGEMGAGKTTLVRNFLRYMGLDEETPVVSPTYTIMNEYKIGNDWYAHLDLYRADDSFSLDEIGVKDARVYKGIFLEWPEVPGEEQTIEPTHILEIEYSDEGNSRTYLLRSV